MYSLVVVCTFASLTYAVSIVSPTLVSRMPNFWGLSIQSIPTVLGNDCILDGVNVKNGMRVLAFSEAPLHTPISCESIERTCKNGKLSGGDEYAYVSCTANLIIPHTSIGPKGEDIAITDLSNGILLMLRASAPHVDLVSKKTVSAIYTLESTDNGATWQEKSIATLYNNTVDLSYSVNGPALIQEPSGRLLGAYHVLTRSIQKNSSVHSIETIYSDDIGVTWHTLSQVDVITVTKDQLQTGLWEPFLIEPTKRPQVLQVYYAKERDNAEVCTQAKAGVRKGQDIVMKESLDGGKTWSALPLVVLRNGQSREGVPTLTELQDGSLVLSHEHARYSQCGNTHPQSGFVPAIALSNDGGHTWIDTGTAYLPLSDKLRSGWPHLLQLQDGRLAIRFSTQNSPSTTTRQVRVLLTTNIPSFVHPPVWEVQPRPVMNGDLQWGTIAQARNGDIIVTGGSDEIGGVQPQMYRVLPISYFLAREADSR